MTADDVNDDENWAGGFYELCLDFGDADDGNLDRAVRTLWRAAGVRGCWVRRADGSGCGYSFDERAGAESLTWRAGLDRWLADVAAAVYAEVPFQRALIGFEVDEDRDITADRRYAAVLAPGPDGLDYRPASA